MFSHFLEFDGEVGGRQTHEVGCQQHRPNSNCVNFASNNKIKPAFSRKAICPVSWLRAVEGESVHLRLTLKYLFERVWIHLRIGKVVPSFVIYL